MSLSRDSLTPGALVLGAGGNVGFGVVGALLDAGSPVLAVGRDGPRMSALAVGRSAVSLLTRTDKRSQSIVTWTAKDAQPPERTVACDFEDTLLAVAGVPRDGRASA